MTQQIAVVVLLAFTCLSCGVYYDLRVEKSGAATIQQHYFKGSGDDNVPKAKDSPVLISYDIISEDKESGGQIIVMEFETVDSLGNYLTDLKPSTIKFNKTENSFEIYTIGSEPYKRDAKCKNLAMRIHFEQKVKEVISDHYDVSKTGDHTVQWGKTIRKTLINKGQPAKIKVLLED